MLSVCYKCYQSAIAGIIGTTFLCHRERTPTAAIITETITVIIIVEVQPEGDEEAEGDTAQGTSPPRLRQPVWIRADGGLTPMVFADVI